MDENPADSLAKLHYQYDGAVAHLRDANQDLVERVPLLGATIYYDPGDDWFILSIGEPSEAATIEVNDVLNLRYDPATWKIRALEIPRLRAFVADYPEAGKFVQALAELASATPGTHVWVPSGKLPEVGSRVRELVPA
jgi:hypothetical protein